MQKASCEQTDEAPGHVLLLIAVVELNVEAGGPVGDLMYGGDEAREPLGARFAVLLGHKLCLYAIARSEGSLSVLRKTVSC